MINPRKSVPGRPRLYPAVLAHMWVSLWERIRGVSKLSSKALAKPDQPGRYADGDGLYLFVDSKQRRFWQLRCMIGGRRHDMRRSNCKRPGASRQQHRTLKQAGDGKQGTA